MNRRMFLGGIAKGAVVVAAAPVMAMLPAPVHPVTAAFYRGARLVESPTMEWNSVWIVPHAVLDHYNALLPEDSPYRA